jgi:DNA repair exonuclease SbcCD ATPase subunit
MDLKNSKIFNKEIMQAVSAFCESQEIKDVDNFMYLCFKQGFDVKRYGLLGKTLNDGEKDLIKEVIVEKRVEIPVEVIKEVEKIVEVPVDRIVEIVKEIEKIVEVPVEKIVTNIEYISDNSKQNELLLKIQQLENETAKKNEELDELSQTLDELRQKLDIKEDNDKVKLLQQTLQNLRGELQQKNEQIKELEKINRDLLNGNQNQGYLLRGSNLNRRI